MSLIAFKFLNLILQCLLLLPIAHTAIGDEIIVADESGILTDGSGKDYLYEPYAETTWILSPPSLANLDPPSSRVFTIVFQAVNIEPCCDMITIFGRNGSESSPPEIITGQNITTVTIRGYDEAVVEFTSDSTVVRDGFTALWYAGEIMPPEWVGKCPDDCFGQGECVDGTCICNWGYAGGNCKNNDLVQLREIYNLCNGADWFNSEGWTMVENNDMCYNPHPEILANIPSDLYGVQCYAGRVTLIELSDNNIDCGPNKFPNLPSTVESIALSNNRINNGFATPMPETLLVIDLHNTSISVPLQTEMRIPFSELGGQVVRLDLSDNKLTGYKLNLRSSDVTAADTPA